MIWKKSKKPDGLRERPPIFVWLTIVGALAANADQWQPVANPIDGLDAIACSQDASTLAAVLGEGGNFYQSTNAGSSWTNTAESVGLNVFCSADAQKVIAYGGLAAVNSRVLFSTNGGLAFQAINMPVRSAAISFDGNMLAIAGTGISVSTNNGATFTQSTLETNQFGPLALSADGRVIYAGMVNPLGPIYVSTNSGLSWQASATPSILWRALACTADGARVIASSWGSPLYISDNSGTDWHAQIPSVPPLRGTTYTCSFLTASLDGSLLVANFEEEGGGVFVSRDFGATWRFDGLPDLTPRVVCTPDGTTLVGVSNLEPVIQHLPPPLVLSTAGSQITLSWPAPSSQYALQQIGDLSGTNWAAVTNAVTVTNYRNTLTLPAPTTGNTFYRLNGPN